MEQLKETLAAGQTNEGTNENGLQAHYSTTEQKVTSATPVYPYYQKVTDTEPAKTLCLAELVALAEDGPTIGPKNQAAALTPFKASGKTQPVAVQSLFYALVTDHDDDDKSADEIRATYDPWNMAYFAYTSASHEQAKHGIKAKRWKPVIPLAYPVDFERYNVLSRGLMLMNCTDAVQSRSQQVFYAPNIITDGAPFDFIDATERPFIDPFDDSHPLVKAAVEAYEAETQRQEAEASKVTPKPRPANVTSEQAGIIDKVNAAYEMEGELQARDYKRIGRRFLSPQSSTNEAGVIILEREGKTVAYSHHGETDPLSNLNHEGHALDMFDVLCVLDYGGDLSKAVKEEANKLDPEGQKQRQREHQAEQAGAEARAEFETATANDPNAVSAVDLFNSLALPPFPVDLLPPVIGNYAKDQAELIGVDPAVIGMAAIGAAAACIDDRIEIQTKRYDPTWTESARLWVGIIGDPSAKKSPGIGKAMAPLFKIDQQWRESTAEALADWQAACDEAGKDGEKPPRPIEKRLILNDATVEKMGDILSKSEPRGILSYQDELSGWLCSMDAYKNGGGKDRAAWLEAYNGGPKAIDRVNRGSTFVENWSACVLGGIQPSVVQSYAHNTNHDGMLQRFILVQASEARMGKDRRPDMEAKASYSDLMQHLTETTAAGETVVTLSEAAHEAREALDEKLHKITVSHPNKFLTAALGKWNGLYARLLLTFHCIDMATERKYPTAKPVSGETAQKVADLMWRTLLPHAVKFYQGLDPVEDSARELAALILAHSWERFSVKRDLNRYWRASRKLKPWEMEETLDRLEAFGWIFPDPMKLNERGRPAAYWVNPGVHSRFTEYATKERERRREVTEMMKDLKA
ncbi:MAG: DUF3987 domain-containing protein [Marinobacter adhaerens]